MANSKALLGFVAGAAVGALAGILYAPDKGTKTRKKIVNKTGDLSDSLKSSFNDFLDKVKHVYAGAKDEAQDIEDKAKAKMSSAKSEIRNSLS